MYPGLYTTLKCAAASATASAYRNYNTTKERFAKVRKRTEMITEIIHNYRTGAVSLTTLLEFALFKCRMYSTELFENGLIIDKGQTIEIVYYLRDTRYTIVTPKKLGLRPILRFETTTDGGASADVIGGDSTDVSESIREKLGPYGNFHNIPTTPKMLGYPDGLVVTYRKGRGTTRTYAANEIISLEIH